MKSSISSWGPGAVLCTLISPSFADTTTTEAPADPPVAQDVQQSTGELGEIMVTAQRRTERLRDVPFTISAQSGDELAREGITSTRDLSIAVPGLTFSTQGAYAQPNIRGVSTTLSQAGADSPIAMYVDGYYQPNQVNNVFDLPDVERVEVLKGPQGTLFGRNATGGAISIHSIDPSFESTGKFTVMEGVFDGGSADTSSHTTVKGYTNVPLIADKLAVLVSGFYDYIPGYLHDDVNGGSYGREESYLGRIKLLFQPTENLRFIAAGTYGRRNDDAGSTLFPYHGATSAGAINPATGTPFYPDAIVPTQPWHTAGEMEGGSHLTTYQKAVSLTSELTIPSIGTLTSRTGTMFVFTNPQVDVDAAYAPSCLAVAACIDYSVRTGPEQTYQQEFSFASEEFGPFRFIAGAFIYADSSGYGANVNFPIGPDGSQRQVNTPGIFYVRSTVRTRAYAGFGEVNFKATDNLLLIAGLRYSIEKKSGDGFTYPNPNQLIPGTHSDATTPRVSVRYDINSSLNAYFTYSKGFKSGVLDSVSFGKPALPEHIDSYEAGLKFGSPKFSGSVAVFHYNYKDIQLQFFDGVNATIGNAASAKISGVDFDTSYSPVDSFVVRVAGSWIPEAKYENYTTGIDYAYPIGAYGLQQQVNVNGDGLRLLKTPKFTANVTPTYTMDTGIGKFDGNVTLYYSSQYNWNLGGPANNNHVFTGSYATVNAQVGYKPNAHGFHGSLYAKNLTNKAYINGTVLSANSDGVQFAPPREIGIGLDYSF